MTFVWTIPESCKFSNKIMKNLFDDNFSARVSFKLKKIAKQSHLSLYLKNVFLCLIHMNETSRTSINHESLIEFMAGIQYSKNNTDAGKLKRLYEISQKSPHGVNFLYEWCRDAYNTQRYTRSDFWFSMRVAVMDAYTIANIFTSQHNICIFYGGESHAQTVNKVLLKNNARNDTVPYYIKAFTIIQNLESVSCFELNGKKIIIIGENHNKTNSEFGNEFVSFLKSFCNTHESIVCLIEKHIYGKNDKLQQDLTCNMPNLAIHKFRCDSFVENNTCKNIDIIPVDNRHFDVGFLRFEIFSPWYESAMFARCCAKFQKRALYDLTKFCEKLRS